VQSTAYYPNILLSIIVLPKINIAAKPKYPNKKFPTGKPKPTLAIWVPDLVGEV
jgi:hypothetical protein